MRTPMRRLVRRPGEPTTSRRATSAFAARLTGSVVGVAGITLMGAGTFGSPAGAFAADRPSSPVNTNVCTSVQECIQPTAVPSTGDQAGCTAIAGLLNVDSLDSSDSYWHFVVPNSEGYELNGTAFNASFSGGNTEFKVTYVQQKGDGGYKGAVVEADGGVSLSWAWVPETGIMDESTEAEGTAAEDTNGNGDFVLSSSCAGDSSATTSSSSTTSSTTPTTTSQTSSSSTSTSSHTTTTVTDPCTIVEDDEDHGTCTTTTSTHSTTSTSHGTTSSSSSTTTSSSHSTSSESSSSTSSSPTTSSSSATTSSTASTSTESTTPVTTSSESSTSNTSNVSGATTSVSSSTASQVPTSSVLGANTTTPSTGADIEFGLGIALLLGGAGVMIGATRINRNKLQ